VIPVDQRGASDCLRACIASIFEIPWEDAPDTAPPPSVDDRSWSQHNIVVAWCKERGVVPWTLEAKPEDRPVLRRGRQIDSEGNERPADFVWPFPFATHYVGGGKGPRGVEHCVVMRQGKVVHDPHPNRDTTIEHIDSITLFVARLG